MSSDDGGWQAFVDAYGFWPEAAIAWAQARAAWLFRGNLEDAEELVQETMLSLVAGIPNMRGSIEHPRAFVLEVTMRRFRSKLRERYAVKRTARLEREVAVVSVEDQAFSAVFQRLVRMGIARLSEEHRQVVELHYDFETGDTRYTVAQMAASMGIPAGTVKSRLFHARRNLARYLIEEQDQREAM